MLIATGCVSDAYTLVRQRLKFLLPLDCPPCLGTSFNRVAPRDRKQPRSSNNSMRAGTSRRTGPHTSGKRKTPHDRLLKDDRILFCSCWSKHRPPPSPFGRTKVKRPLEGGPTDTIASVLLAHLEGSEHGMNIGNRQNTTQAA